MSDTKTEENLKMAFVGEAKAHFRLLGYAEQAEKDEMPQIAALFRAIAEAEKVHALKNFRLMEAVGDTQTNLEKSFESEMSVSDNIYPELIKTAAEEGNKKAQMNFTHARDAEEFHAQLYKKALDHMMSDEDALFNVCTVCGYVVDGEAPDECPVCNAKKQAFVEVR